MFFRFALKSHPFCCCISVSAASLGCSSSQSAMAPFNVVVRANKHPNALQKNRCCLEPRWAFTSKDILRLLWIIAFYQAAFSIWGRIFKLPSKRDLRKSHLNFKDLLGIVANGYANWHRVWVTVMSWNDLQITFSWSLLADSLTVQQYITFRNSYLSRKLKLFAKWPNKIE